MRGNEVSFFLGELVIGSHGCNPLLGGMRRQLVSPLPTFVQKVLHLLCESAMPFHSMEGTRRQMTSAWRACRGAPLNLHVWALSAHSTTGGTDDYRLYYVHFAKAK